MKAIFPFVFCFMQALNVLAVPVLVYTDSSEAVYLGEYAEYFEADRSSGIEEAMRREEWTQNKNKVFIFGTTKNCFWIRFKLLNVSESDEIIIEAPLPYIDHFQVFNSSNIKYPTTQLAGDIYPFNKRLIKNTFPTFIIDCIDSSSYIYIKVYSDETLMIPIQVKNYRLYAKTYSNRKIFFGAYTGIIISMLIYNLVLFIITKDNTLLYYLLYLFSVGVTQIALIDGAVENIYSNSKYLCKTDVFLFSSFLGLNTTPFVLKFLKIKQHSKNIYNYIIFLCFLYLLLILNTLIGNLQMTMYLLNILNLLSSFSLLIIGFYLVGREPMAKFFVFSWSIFLTGSILFILSLNNIVPYNNLSHYSMTVGTIIETVFLSMTLGYKINILQKELKQKDDEMFYERERIQGDSMVTRVMELDSVRFKMNPHFVYNAVTSIKSALTSKKVSDSVTEYLDKFATLMRDTLNNTRNQFTTLEEEVEFLNEYLSIEQMRLGETFKYDIVVEEEMMGKQYLLPAMMIQPFAENAVKHAFKGVKNEKRIFITFKKNPNKPRMSVAITDNGIGLQNGYRTWRTSGYRGIDMILYRLKMLYDGNPEYDARIDIKDKTRRGGKGVTVQLDFPFNQL